MKYKLIKTFKVGRATRYKMECLECGTDFIVNASRFNKGNSRFCCNKCSYSYQVKKAGRAPRYKGRIKRSGYWYLRLPEHPSCKGKKQPYVAEHRVVMEKHIGRLLDDKEVVHHINHDPADNRIENLELCESAGKHIAEHHPEVMEKLRIAGTGRRPWNKDTLTHVCKKCPECGSIMEGWPSEINRRTWCSLSCANKNKVHGPSSTSFKKGHTPWNAGKGAWLDVTCLYCQKKMRVRKCRYDAGRGKYCSKACMYSRKPIP